MAKGYGYRGGGARRSAGSRGSARQSSGSGGGTQRKGQIKSGKAVQYTIKDQKGNTKYIGTTNNPSRRATEHRETGKLGRKDKLVVETRAISRKSAESVERGKLSSFRQEHERNPKHNSTNDGKFHR